MNTKREWSSWIYRVCCSAALSQMVFLGCAIVLQQAFNSTFPEQTSCLLFEFNLLTITLMFLLVFFDKSDWISCGFSIQFHELDFDSFFPVSFRSCTALIMIWVAFRANLVNALQQLPQISSARAQLDVSLRDLRDGCSDWMVCCSFTLTWFHIFFIEKGIQMNVWIMDFPLLRSFQQQFSLSLFWAALFLWGVYRGYNNKKRKHLVCISLN